MAGAFGISLERLSMREAFVAMYDTQLQRELSMHKDGTLLACTVALNSVGDDFEGGGTVFAAPLKVHRWEMREWEQPSWAEDCARALSEQAESVGASEDDGVSAYNDEMGIGGGGGHAAVERVHNVVCRAGDVLLQCGQLRHGGQAITRGRRYVLVCFIDELQVPHATLHSPADSSAEGVEVVADDELVCRSTSAIQSTPSPSSASHPVAGCSPPEMSTPCGSAGSNRSKEMDEGSSVASARVRARRSTDSGTRPRLVSFGVMDSPTSAVPERKGRFTLPGGKPAFAPGWNTDVPITDEGENDDTPPPCCLTLSVGGKEVIAAAPVLLEREATFRLPAAVRFNPRRAPLECTITEDGATAAHLCTDPSCGADEWVGTGKRDRCSLALDVPGFTICFEAATKPSAADEAEAMAEAEAMVPTEAKAGTESKAGATVEAGAEVEASRVLEPSDEERETSSRYELVAVRIVRQANNSDQDS
eukprot:CAMPEP_0174700384 /NCGR_PEP_ID=MMETSP1094-20130205/5348_1 /TAXON_ID=156173 /ORGANISM="Chrysochromulina brevifilum, Strain UTEX LB 985" /LENGTH=476 /DNA_ID=CAMNT_0015897853 /DNA_START=52 /DNA_END=1482 /DNA_ORIENTATION=+